MFSWEHTWIFVAYCVLSVEPAVIFTFYISAQTVVISLLIARRNARLVTVFDLDQREKGGVDVRMAAILTFLRNTPGKRWFHLRICSYRFIVGDGVKKNGEINAKVGQQIASGWSVNERRNISEIHESESAKH